MSVTLANKHTLLACTATQPADLRGRSLWLMEAGRRQWLPGKQKDNDSSYFWQASKVEKWPWIYSHAFMLMTI